MGLRRVYTVPTTIVSTVHRVLGTIVSLVDIRYALYSGVLTPVTEVLLVTTVSGGDVLEVIESLGGPGITVLEPASARARRARRTKSGASGQG